MTTYCRVPVNTATDVCFGDDKETAVSNAFAAEYIQQVGGLAEWLPVQDGVTVQSGWVVTVTDGVVTASVAPAPPPPVPQVLDKQTFNDTCINALGGIPVGLGAFQTILDTAVSKGGAAKGFVTYYNGAVSFTLDITGAFFAVLVTAQAMTQLQSDDIIAAWPMVS